MFHRQSMGIILRAICSWPCRIVKRGLVKIRISASDRFLDVSKPIKITTNILLRGANDSLKPSNPLLFELLLYLIVYKR